MTSVSNRKATSKAPTATLADVLTARSNKSQHHRDTELPPLTAALSVGSFVREADSRVNCTPQLQYEGDRHLIPERLPSARRDRAVSLKLTRLTDDNLSHLLLLAGRLRRLDLTNVGLTQLPMALVDNLRQLECLIVDHNDLTAESFPRNMGKLEHLMVLSARGNKINRLCEAVQCMRALRRLNLESNDLANLKGVECLAQLRSLLLDNNQLSQLPSGLYTLRHLEVLYVSNNRLTTLSSNVKNLTFLQELKLSDNRMRTLPAAVFYLPRLQSLSASRNVLDSIPSLLFKGGAGGRRLIDDVDLSENQLTAFPASLPFASRHLDLSRNFINSIPDPVLRRLTWPCNDRSWDLRHNPMQQPPQHVCEAGLGALMQYYHETRFNSPAFQGLKLLFVGATNSGKTSLVQTLIDTRTRLTESAADQHTLVCDFYYSSVEIDMTSTSSISKSSPPEVEENKVNAPLVVEVEEEANIMVESPPGRVDLCLIDYSSDAIYEGFLHLFARNPVLLMVCIDASQYRADQFVDKVGHYLDLIVHQDNFLFCLPILTKTDLVTGEVVAKFQADIYHAMQSYLAERLSRIDAEIGKIDSQSVVTMAMTEQLKLFLKLKALRVHLFENVVACSVRELRTIQKLQEIVTKCLKFDAASIFEHVMKPIPPLWRDVEDTLEEESLQRPLKPLDSYLSMVQDQFGLKPVAMNIVHYLQDSGRILWFDRGQEEVDELVLSPNTLALCLRRLVHTNFRAYLDDPLDRDEVQFRFLERNHNNLLKWNYMVNQACCHGVITASLLAALWSDLLTEAQLCSVLGYICCHLQLGFPIGEKPTFLRKASITSSSDKSDVPDSEDERVFPYNLNPLPQLVRAENSPTAPPVRGKSGVKFADQSSKKLLTATLRVDDSAQVMKTKDHELFEEGVIPPVFMPILCPHEICPNEYLTSQWEKRCADPLTHQLVNTMFVLQDEPVFGLSYRLIVLMHDYASFKFHFLTVWKNGVCLSCEEHTCELRIVSHRLGDGRQAISVQIAPVSKSLLSTDATTDGDNVMHQLWICLLQVLRCIENLLLQFQGLCFRRHAHCPLCKEAAFIGEWTSPKEMQLLNSTQCRICTGSVPIAYLVPPKEKRNAEQIFKLKEEMKARRAAQEANTNHTAIRQLN